MRTFYRFFSSVTLFLVGSGVLVVLSVVASIVPGAFGRTDFFRSVLFFALIALLELNLVLCTVPRLAGRLRTRTASLFSYGPDFIHLGLIIAVIGGVLTFSLREQERFLVPIGASVIFGTDNRSAREPAEVTVAASREVLDSRGIVVDWVITLENDGERYELAINDPIRIAGYRVHFFHWGREPVLVLSDANGVEYPVHAGEGLRGPDGTGYAFIGVESGAKSGSARIGVLAPDGTQQAVVPVKPGDSIGRFTVTGTTTEVLNGFSAGRDPGRPVVIAGLLFFIAGMVLYGSAKWRSYG